jgi:hypothetical protein
MCSAVTIGATHETEERQMSATTVQRFLMCLMASVFMLALVGAVSFVAAQASTTSNTADRHLYPN